MTACTDKPGYLPAFQGQNPGFQNDAHGWDNCTAYAAGMAADFDSCGTKHLTGKQIRALSNEPVPDPKSPGLSLRQIDDALNRRGVDLETRYTLSWADFARKIDKGEGAVLQLETGPFLATTFRSTKTPINHAIFVPPGWGAMDPAADGRKRDYPIHKYDGQPYPRDLLKKAAGQLVLVYSSNGVPVRRLGEGSVYASFTRDRRATWSWQHEPGKFVLWSADDHKRTCRPVRTQDTGGTEPHSCTAPRLYKAPDGSSRSLVRMLAGAYAGQFVHARFATEVP